MKQQHNNPVLQLTDPQLCALDQLSTLFTTMAPGVELTMLNPPLPPNSTNVLTSLPTFQAHWFHNCATTYTLACPQPLTQHPSHMPTLAHPWNTVMSSWFQQPKTYGFALLPMNSAVWHNDSLTNALIILTPSFSSPLTRFLQKNDQPTHISSAAITLKKLNLIVHT